jgi:hypothetical protein
MGILILAIICSVLTLAIIWLCLVATELRGMMKLYNYLLNVASYNDFVFNLRTQPNVTPEEEFQVVRMQTRLIEEAISIGQDAPCFNRPKGADPDESGPIPD